MAGALSEYHRGVAATNRAALLEAATALFLDQGYDRTSLARVAAAAGVSKATLFKQFPTKAALFEAVVLAAGGAADGDIPDPPGDDFIAGLTEIGLAYAALLERPRIVALMRTIIAESPRFSELGERTFDFGTLPAIRALHRFFVRQRALGAATVDDVEAAAAQYLGMIATVVFWPRLVHGGWTLTPDEVERVVREAAATMAARYA